MTKCREFFHGLKRDWQLVLLVLPGVIFYLIYRYLPMYGLIIAFKDYGIYTGINGSPWAGLKYFQEFFSSGDFFLLFKNTLLIGVYSLLWSFPFPIILAILLNEMRLKSFKKLVQTVTFLPSFLSTVVVCSMVIDFLSPSTGIINTIIKACGGEPIYFMTKPEWFRTIYISSGIWQQTGYNAVIYLAALTSLDTSLLEAAEIDGCGRLKKIWYIVLPSLMPIITIMFILNSGNIFKAAQDKMLLLYNPATYSVSDIFSTFTYRKGIVENNYSYSTAVGFFEAMVSLIVVTLTNYMGKKMNDTSLW